MNHIALVVSNVIPMWHHHPLMIFILVPCDLCQRHADKIHSCSASHQWSTAAGQVFLPLCVSLIEQESDGSKDLISAEFHFQASTLVLLIALSASRLMRQREKREMDMGTLCNTVFRQCVTLLLMHPTIMAINLHLYFAFASCYILETD